MELSRITCDRARRARDARFDGRFFIAVTSTGVYCRPICPARTALDANVRYYPSASAAEAAGFRPCLRCRPEASPGTPAWLGTSALVSRALRLIGDGALDDAGVDTLADRLGITARHLRRLFVEHLGATPVEIAHTRRVHFAKKLLDETDLRFDEVAAAAGFGSVRRFYSEIRRTYARTPNQLRRRKAASSSTSTDSYRFKLAYRPPYDWDALLGYLGDHAIDGVERVDDASYARTICLDGHPGTIEVHRGDPLVVDIRIGEPRLLLGIVERVRRMFDLGADPQVIGAHLAGDPLLARVLANHPGIRIAGAWDPIELGVRAILGSSKRAAQTLATLADRFGMRAGDRPVFPTAASLVTAKLDELGIDPAKVTAIQRLAAGDSLADVSGVSRASVAVVDMRTRGEPDIFPSHDRALQRATHTSSVAELERRSGSWQPWRAYAAMLLWTDASS